MAEQETGVKPASSGAATSPDKKKQKLLMYGGIGLAGLLLLSHRGSSSGPSQTGGQAGQLLDAYQQGIQDAAGIQTGSMGVGTAGVPGGSAMGSGPTTDSSGANFNPTPATDGSVPTDTSGSPATPTVVPPPPTAAAAVGSSSAAAYNKAFNAKFNAKWAAKHSHAKGHGKSGENTGAGKPSSVQVHDTVNVSNKIYAGEPHPAKPAPAKSSGKHPETSHVTKHGKRKKSPVVLEAMDGAGHGTTVMGRDFPGATGHRLGPPRSSPNRGILRDVIVFYGGRTEVHTCGENGKWWLDNTPGRNPLQNRTVPHVITS